MKLWISICIQKGLPSIADACIHFKEPVWCDDTAFVDGGCWDSGGSEEHPCMTWVRKLLQDLELPTRPRELLEITISESGRWDWR